MGKPIAQVAAAICTTNRRSKHQLPRGVEVGFGAEAVARATPSSYRQNRDLRNAVDIELQAPYEAGKIQTSLFSDQRLQSYEQEPQIESQFSRASK